jgi:hypothetical protein
LTNQHILAVSVATAYADDVVVVVVAASADIAADAAADDDAHVSILVQFHLISGGARPQLNCLR